MDGSNPRRHPQAGFSLVEIMIAATLGLLLTAAIMKLFVESRQAYQDLDGVNEIQENGRFALEFLGHGLRMADHWGGAAPDEVDGTISMTSRGSCTAAWISQPEWGIEGYDGASAVGSVDELPASCIASANYVAGSDLLMVRYADPDGVMTDTALASATLPVVRVTAGIRGRLLDGGSTPPRTCRRVTPPAIIPSVLNCTFCGLAAIPAMMAVVPATTMTVTPFLPWSVRY